MPLPDFSPPFHPSKQELHSLADMLLQAEPEAVESCVRFVCMESGGFWHGRARAMMCRRLKHCELTPAQQACLLTSITGRLGSGTFSEQFKDQLRLALHLDPQQTFAACRQFLSSPRAHVRRYAAWVLSHPRAGEPGH